MTATRAANWLMLKGRTGRNKLFNPNELNSGRGLPSEITAGPDQPVRNR
jgi:hypothetical protein